MRARAFTLIEILLVVLIMGIGAAAVSLSLGSSLQRRQVQDVTTGVRQFDQTSRHYARTFGQRIQLVFDLDGGRILRQQGDASAAKLSGEYVLPQGYRLAGLLVDGRQCHDGRAAIHCSDRGCSPSYAVGISDGKSTRWVLFAGLSGAAVERDDEKDVQQTLAALLPLRHDTH